MANKKNEEEDLLTLGDAYVKLEQKEKKQRKKTPVYAVIMMIVGFSLMIVGIFYNDFIKILSNDKEEIKTNIKDETNSLDKELDCSLKKEDETMGVKTITSYNFKFKNRSLKSYDMKIVYSVIENSDIGADNLKVVAKNYQENIKKFNNINGLSINEDLNDNRYMINMNVNFNLLDKTKLPVDDKIKVLHDKDEDYRNVKKVMVTELNTMCE